MFNPGDKLLNDERYEIIEEVGRGGMGIVYKAQDANLDRLVAIKVLPLEIAGDRRAIRHLKHEARTAAGLQHENIVAIYDLSEYEGRHFIAMEFVDGQTLDDIAIDNFPLPIEQVLDITIQICAGLQYIHDREILHRDIKPKNIMVLANGLVKITDFGIAHIVKQTVTRLTSRTTGTMPYMSPEQFAAKPADARSDIYALGISLYEILTDDLPFPGPDFAYQHLKVKVESPTERRPTLDIPPRLSAIVMKCLEKDPVDRHASISELLTSLKLLQQSLSDVKKIPELIRQAQSEYNVGNYEMAIQLWQRILDINPDNGKAKSGIAQVQRILTERQAEEERQAKINSLFRQAQEESVAGNYQRVIELSQQVLKFDPDNSVAKEGLEHAKEHVDQKERQAKIQALIRQAQDKQRARKFQEAIQVWTEILEIAPEEQIAKSGLDRAQKLLTQEKRQAKINSLFRQAQEESIAGNYQRVIELSQQILEIDPDNEDAKSSIKITQKALDHQQRELERLIGQAQVEQEVKNFREAIRIWKQILETDPKNQTAKSGLKNAEASLDEQHRKERDNLIRNARDEQRAGNLKEAIQLWKKVLWMDPENPVAKSKLEAAKKSLTERNKERDSLMTQARDQEQAGDLEGAIQTWKKVLQIDPENEIVKRNLETDQKILAKEQAREREDQERKKKEEVERQTQTRTLITQAQNQERAGNLENARQTWQQVLQIAPENRIAKLGLERTQTSLQQQSTLKKIDFAVAAASVFIHHLHRENFDRGMIATFGNTFRVEQSFTSNESYLQSSLAKVKNSIENEGTRLYDSIEDVISEFWKNGKRERPWVLTIITDGKDYYDWGKYHNNPVGIGRHIALRFNHEPSNFIFIIGVGEGNQIDKNALATVADYGGFLAVTIGAFPLLERIFLEIALKVSTQLVGTRYEVGNLSWEEVARIRQVSHTPIDYAFLIDRSGSMKDPG